MFSYEDDPSKYSHAVHTLTYSSDYDVTAVSQASYHLAGRYESFTTKALEVPTMVPVPATASYQSSAKRGSMDKTVAVPYQTILEREVHVRMPVQDVLNKQITVTCSHANCQNTIRTCHFHTCPHCGDDKRYAEAMCPACARDPKRSTAKGGNNPAAHVYLPNIPEGALQRLRCIGGGTHSSVHEVLYDGLPACEKVLLKNDPSVLLDEARVMAQVDRHPNVLRIYGMCQRGNGETSIVLELMQYDLLDILKTFAAHLTKSELPKVVPNLVDYVGQAANGLRHMHRHGVVHRDVAARNMLFGNDVIKVADFGLAKCTSNRSTSGLPKPLSTAPECIRDLDNPAVWIDKSDVWSFGLMICEVFELGADPLEQFHHSVPALMEGLDRGWLPKRPPLCPDPIWEVTLRCLRQKAHERPGMDDVAAVLTNYRSAHRHEPKLPAKTTLMDAKAAFFEMSAPPTPTQPPITLPHPSSFAAFVPTSMDPSLWPTTLTGLTPYQPALAPGGYEGANGASEGGRAGPHYNYEVRALSSPIDIVPAPARPAHKSESNAVLGAKDPTPSTDQNVKPRANSHDGPELAKPSASVPTRVRPQARPSVTPLGAAPVDPAPRAGLSSLRLPAAPVSRPAAPPPSGADPPRRPLAPAGQSPAVTMVAKVPHTSPRKTPDYSMVPATFY